MVDLLFKFSKEEIGFLASLYCSSYFGLNSIKQDIGIKAKDEIYYGVASRLYNIDDAKLLGKLDELSEEEAIDLAKFIEFLYYRDDLPLNISTRLRIFFGDVKKENGFDLTQNWFNSETFVKIEQNAAGQKELLQSLEKIKKMKKENSS